MKEYVFWAALPPLSGDLTLLEKAAGFAEPLLDLRYGGRNYKESITKKAVRRGLAGLTVFADYQDKNLVNFLLNFLPGGSRVILSSANPADPGLRPLIDNLKKKKIIAGIETDSRKGAWEAQTKGADFLVASGNEAYGPVSPKTSLVLIQELLEGLDIPLVLRGSLGPQAAAAVFAAGCTGCILDSQLLLLNDSFLNSSLKEKLKEISPYSLKVVGDCSNYPYRFFGKNAENKYEEILREERNIFLKDIPGSQKSLGFEHILKPFFKQGFNNQSEILPVGQGIVFSQQFAAKGLGVKEVLKIYFSALNLSLANIKNNFPFSADSPFARYHQTKYPLIQGPMACISDNLRFSLKVSEAGALPFVSLAGHKPEQNKKLIKNARSLLKGKKFGVGIVGFSSQEDLENQIEAVSAALPDFAIIAGAGSRAAARLEKAGIQAYLHAPSPVHLKEFLDNQVKGVILEGCESGGHVGVLGSLVLWELGTGEFIGRFNTSDCPVKLIFAGGINTPRAVLAAAVLASPLIGQNIIVGLQMGTAYLMTEEAVKSGAVPAKYQNVLLEGSDTLVTGKGVNLPVRWLSTKSLLKMIGYELELREKKLSLSGQKRKVRSLAFKCLQAAVKNKKKGKGQSGALEDFPAYMCGQVIALQKTPRKITGLHKELTEGALQLARACPISAEAWEPDENAVAIIGMGCIFPDANNVDEYWANIINRRYSIRQLPKERCDIESCYHPERGKMGKSYSKIGAFIKGFKKNPLKFRIPPVSAPFIERIQFLMLEATYQALEDAGYLKKDFPRKKTAVFVGSRGRGEMGILHHVSAYWNKFADSFKSIKEFKNLPQDLKKAIIKKAGEAFNKDMPKLSEDTCGGVFGSIVASRINHCFNLGGTSLTLDAACASSLAAIDIGVRGLREKRFDLAFTGAVDGCLNLGQYILFSSQRAISAKGSFPFDERADGLVLGEGAGMILLKRLNDAIRDKDKIYAVIRELGTASDGRAKGITAPDADGQVRALEHTYENLSLNFDSVSFIEAHGTGTWLGDKTEAESLTNFFRRYSQRKKAVGLGSVKSMIGHLKAAAGIAGIIKVAQAFKNQVLPPTINCEKPRKDIDWENSPFYLLTKPCSWEKGYLPRRAAINSFGFGGINYHALLEEPPSKEYLSRKGRSNGRRKESLSAKVLFFRAPTRKKLIGFVEKAKAELSRVDDSDFTKIAGKFSGFSSPKGPALAVVAAGVNECIARLDKAHKLLNDSSRLEFSLAQGIYFSQAQLKPGQKVAFLFPGLGSQYLGMGGDLPEYFPLVKEIFHKVDSISRRHTGDSVLPLLSLDKTYSFWDKSRLQNFLIRSEYNHPAMLALSAGIFQLLLQAGIKPDMACGHSLGEYFALYAVGVFDIQSIIELIMVRGGEISKHCFENGAMASINMPPNELSRILKKISGFVVIANKNCPAQTVVSGKGQDINNLISYFEKKGILCKKLPVSSAYHTSFLKPSAESFRKFMDKFEIYKPRIPVQSNLTGRAYRSTNNFSSEVRNSLANHLISPVEFIKNVQSLYKDGARLFIEAGPGSTLSSFVDNILFGKPHWVIPTNLQRRSASLQILHSLAFCAVRGLPADLKKITSGYYRQPLTKALPQPPLSLQEEPTFSRQRNSRKFSFIEEALSGEKKDLARDYLKERNSYLKETVCLDFENFKKNKLGRATSSTSAGDKLELLIVNTISKKTGYPADTIGLDLDIEAELGLDSIKQLEIIREIADRLGIDFGKDLRSYRYRMTTPRKLIEACRKFSPQEIENKSPTTFEKTKVKGSQKIWDTDCYRWISEKIEFPLKGERNTRVFRGRSILLLVNSVKLDKLLSRRLKKAGAVVFSFSSDNKIEDLPEYFDWVLDFWSYPEGYFLSGNTIKEWWLEIKERSEKTLKVSQKLAGLMRRHQSKRFLWMEAVFLGGELGEGKIEPVSGTSGIGLGIMRCLEREFPKILDTFCLDFSLREAGKKICEAVFNELLYSQKEPEAGYIDGKRFKINWKIDSKYKERPKFRLNSQSVIVAVGGARGITASICRKLAQTGKSRFILVGRSSLCREKNIQQVEPITFEQAKEALVKELRTQGKPVIPAEVGRAAWQRVWNSERSRNVEYLRGIASEVIYQQCDITKPESIRRLVKKIIRKYHKIDLVINGASDLIEKSVEDLDSENFIAKMESKALGTACLISALEDTKVDTFVNFSSVAGRWGNKGQASYAAGHEIAAILVSGARRKFSGRWINIFFGPWLGVGMIRIGDVMKRLQAQKSNFITDETGGNFFLNELLAGGNQNVAFCGPERLRSIYKKKKHKVSLASLIEHIDIVSPGKAEGYSTFDLKRDRFIAEHYVDYENPIMPGVVSLEIVAQAASVLLGKELPVTEIKNISFPRPGIFPRSEPRKFYVRVRLLSKGEKGIWFYGEVFSLFSPPDNKEERQIQHLRCNIRFGQRKPPQAPSLLLVKAGLGNWRVDAAPLWDTERRQGRQGIFRTIDSFSSVTPEGAEGEIFAPPVQESGKYPLLGNLMRLDGLIDLINLSTNIFQNNESSLSGGIESIKFFISDNSQGRRFCRARIREITEKNLICDIEAMDDTGKVTEVIKGVQKQNMDGVKSLSDLSEPIWEFLKENPRQRAIKRFLGYRGRLALGQVNISLVKNALSTDKNKLLSGQLSDEEGKYYRGLKCQKRRLEWLSGRIAAKAVVRMYFGTFFIFPSAVTIKGSSDNSPYIIMDSPQKDDLPHISISHSNDIAVAVIGEDSAIGIDTEKITGSILEIADDFSGEAERKIIDDAANFARMVKLTYIWAIKEAARKAVGARNLSMKEIIFKNARAHKGYLICDLCGLKTKSISAIAFQDNEYIYAVGMLKK